MTTTLLNDAGIAERVFHHIANGTTDMCDEVWREPVVNYRMKERLEREIRHVLRRSPAPFCPSEPKCRQPCRGGAQAGRFPRRLFDLPPHQPCEPARHNPRTANDGRHLRLVLEFLRRLGFVFRCLHQRRRPWAAGCVK